MADIGTVITTGSTYENMDNLSSAFIKLVIRKYENTSLGAQELHARILDQADGALWTREIIELTRTETFPNLVRIVVAIDPMARASENARRRVAPPETGIIVAGLGEDDHAYVLGDYSCTNAKPDEWAAKAIQAYNETNADRIIAEVNNGGDMVEDVIKTREPNIPFKKVHASRGKRVRAEPIAALYEQGKVHHTSVYANLESQLCAWTGSDGEPSPDRLDALVWALTELMLGSSYSADINFDASLGRGRSTWRDA
jgi:phage terminase large subunit-like protein